MSLGQKLSKVLISKSTSLLSNIVLISQLGSALMLVDLRGSTACSAFLALGWGAGWGVGWGKPGSAVDSDMGHCAAVGLGSLLASAPVAVLVLAVIEIPLVQVG